MIYVEEETYFNFIPHVQRGTCYLYNTDCKGGHANKISRYAHKIIGRAKIKAASRSCPILVLD